jgi:SHS2 domain-containing protein
MQRFFPQARKYRQLAHTADLGLQVWGRTRAELFENAAEGLVSVITDRRRLRARIHREIEVEAPDMEALLIVWLNHLLYLYDVEAFLGSGFEVASLCGERLTALVWGEPFDPARHIGKSAVKAATYHQLKITRLENGWQARVILDL